MKKKEQQTIELQQQNIKDNKVIKKQWLSEKLSEKTEADTCTLKRKNATDKSKQQKKKKLVRCSNIVSSNENVTGDGEKCDAHKEQIDVLNNEEQLVNIVDVDNAFLSKQNTQLQPLLTLSKKEDIFDVDKLFASKGNTKNQQKSKLKKKEIGLKINHRYMDNASLGIDFRTDIVKDTQDVKNTEIVDEIVISDDDDGSVEIICDDDVMVTEKSQKLRKGKIEKGKSKRLVAIVKH